MANKFEHTDVATREFTLEFLQQITHDFSDERIIGNGGYGVVYKGELHNRTLAVKKLHYMTGFNEAQFRNVCNDHMRVQHPNIIRLVGYYINQGHQRIKHGGEYNFAPVEGILCMEYLPNGSLDKYISDESCGLDWSLRFKIIKGVCEGLNYLLNGSKDPIYHLDLKPGNILLEGNLNPKIGDFGLSRFFRSEQTNNTSQFVGTSAYLPPEFIERKEITSKFHVFSLGVIIIEIMTGGRGYSRHPEMSLQEIFEQVYENWGKRLQARMSLPTSEQVKACIKIAFRCVKVDSEKRPTIAKIVDELNNLDIVESSPIGQVANFRSKHALNQNMNSGHRGRITFCTTYRPPVALDIFSCPSSPSSTEDELLLTDGMSCNYNGRPIPPAALKTLLKSPKVANESKATDADIDAGHVSGVVFVSERDDNLETLYIALRFNADRRNVKIFSLADIFGAANFSGMRLEDSGSIGGGYGVGSGTIDHSLIYVSTKEPVQKGRSPRTAVYKTNLRTGKTERLTPQGMSDLSPAVSPSGKKVAVASLRWNRCDGENEKLETDICLMNVDKEGCRGLGRMLIIKNGGWPSWGSDNIIFFHRGVKKLPEGMDETSWAVFRYNISTKETVQVTPHGLDAVTPAAISETKVAVVTIRHKAPVSDVNLEMQNRHIEIFDTSTPELPPVCITHEMRPKSDHYNPFILDGGSRIGYHRSLSDQLWHEDRVDQNLYKQLESPLKDVDLYRVPRISPTITKDGSKLAFVDKEDKVVWVADSHGLRIVFESEGGSESVFYPVWNQNPDKDILYVCVGTSFNRSMPMEIYAIHISKHSEIRRLTDGGFNNTFPSSSPDGNKLVFRSTRNKDEYKNLYIMEDQEFGQLGEGMVSRLTNGPWIDTHCQWSPNGDWIVFSSTRDNQYDAARVHPYDPEKEGNCLDPRYFSVFLVKPWNPLVVIRVMSCGADIRGHINHPVFSPDGRSIAVTADLAGASVEPISLPTYSHPVRSYGDIFVVDINDGEDLMKNQDVNGFCRMTHSMYECGALAWTSLFATRAHAEWNMLMKFEDTRYKQACPYAQLDGGESWHMTGHPSTPPRELADY